MVLRYRIVNLHIAHVRQFANETCTFTRTRKMARRFHSPLGYLPPIFLCYKLRTTNHRALFDVQDQRESDTALLAPGALPTGPLCNRRTGFRGGALVIAPLRCLYFLIHDSCLLSNVN